MCGEPCDGVADAFIPCFGTPDGIAPIGVPGRAHVPASHAMGCPTALCIGPDMGQDACAGWGNRCAIEVKGAIDVCPGRQLGVVAATTEIEGEFGLWEQVVP